MQSSLRSVYKKSEYREIIDDVIKLLSGKHLDIVENFKLNMEKAAENLEFEKQLC